MKRVTGIGGILFKANDPVALREWCRQHLGINVELNYRVEDLHAMLTALRTEGCAEGDKFEESEFCKFGWVVDPEENCVERWEPPAGQ